MTVNYLPKGKYLLAGFSIIIMSLMAIVFIAAFRRCHELLRAKNQIEDRYGDLVLEIIED